MFFEWCFFKDRATPEINASLHTLSLRDALPICSIFTMRVCRRSITATTSARWRRTRVSRTPSIFLASCPPISARCSAAASGRFAGRSEEHTSELQSLMRISYAVFCLTKKKKKHNINNDNKDYLNNHYSYT